MIDPDIKEQLDRIEQYSLIAVKNVLTINEAAIILGMAELKSEAAAYCFTH